MRRAALAHADDRQHEPRFCCYRQWQRDLVAQRLGNTNRVNDGAGINLSGGILARTGTVSEGTAASTTDGGGTHMTSAAGVGTHSHSMQLPSRFRRSGVGTLVFSNFVSNDQHVPERLSDSDEHDCLYPHS